MSTESVLAAQLSRKFRKKFFYDVRKRRLKVYSNIYNLPQYYIIYVIFFEIKHRDI